MTLAFAIEWTPAHGPTRKVVFEPTECTWRRTEFELRESQWRQIGTERIETVSLTSEGESTHETCLERGEDDE